MVVVVVVDRISKRSFFPSGYLCVRMVICGDKKGVR